MTKKTKFLILIIIILWGVVLYVLQNKESSHVLLPSLEMQKLRAVETQLEIPKANRRSENDKGCYTDGKGAPHYNRYIYYNYAEKKDMYTIIKILESNNWQPKYSDLDYEGKTDIMSSWQHESYTNVQIFIMIEEGVTINTNPHTMFIKDTSRDHCN